MEEQNKVMFEGSRRAYIEERNKGEERKVKN
jgi:hypothetical protein